MELGKNKITKIEGIANLNNLLQLSLEDNGIESLV
jgi:Leucine-rich repeat (LRR) protein